MFYYIKGELVRTDPSSAVIDCGGIGYKMTVSKNTLSRLTRPHEKVCLYTYFYIREDALELLGFYTEAELEAFKLLITVSGIGPKAAIAILSVLTPEKFALAVTMGDVKAIAKASGVGSKTAARVVLELKEKVAKTFPAAAESADTAEPVTDELVFGNVEEAISALMVLGYTRQEAQAALKGVDPLLSLEDMIAAALRKMGPKF
ncbi:MAG: Holliday junction branch migration protein RuvA [Clostridia bacterium]|nr:Holliday junction branch migration protein RuvA [Clostridia bacterium]